VFEKGDVFDERLASRSGDLQSPNADGKAGDKFMGILREPHEFHSLKPSKGDCKSPLLGLPHASERFQQHLA
jgi:hypothetical protein